VHLLDMLALDWSEEEFLKGRISEEENFWRLPRLFTMERIL
jgi:hypothetical protein